MPKRFPTSVLYYVYMFDVNEAVELSEQLEPEMREFPKGFLEQGHLRLAAGLTSVLSWECVLECELEGNHYPMCPLFISDF